MIEKRDTFKRFIVKYFLLSLFALFALVGIAKQIIYGTGPEHGRRASETAPGHALSLGGGK